MIRQMTKRFFMGMPFGITYGLLVSLLNDYGRGSQIYQPYEARFAEHFSSSLHAFTVAIILWALIGSLFSTTSVLFQKENWSLTRQTLTHFVITVLGFMMIAYFAGWYPLNINSIASELIVFVVIYVATWSYTMIRVKRSIDAINKKIKNK